MPVRFTRLARCVSATVAAALLLGGCSGGKRMSATVPTGELPDQEVSDFVLTETDQGRPEWTLYARLADMYLARNVIVVRGVRVDFFDEKAQRSSQLSAREGEIQQQTRDMTARGGVVLATAEGTRMSTEQLRYLNRSNQITSDVRVRVERQGDVLEGVGFRSDPELRHFEFQREVVAHVRGGSSSLLERQRKGGK